MALDWRGSLDRRLGWADFQRKIGSAAMTLIKLADERLGETEVVKMPEGVEPVYSSRVRSLVDSVYDWSRFN